MPPITNSPDYDALPSVLTTEQFAQFFKVTKQTILNWRKREYIQPIKGTRPYRWPKDQVMRRLTSLQPSAIY
jgi:hypothetical protein